MRIWQTNPFEDIVLTRGQGCTVWDRDGKAYLDLLSGTWCTVLGHGHPRLTEVIHEQTRTLVHAGPLFLSDGIEQGLQGLTEILPASLSRAVFLNTGSEAVELALKMARAATGAGGIAVMERGYYGATTYALSLSEVGRGMRYLPAVGEVLRLPAPNCRCCPAAASWPCSGFPCLDPLRAVAGDDRADDDRVGDDRAGDIAAVLYEPVLANGGVIVPPIGYGAELRSLADQCGALLISEEVTTGMGRTGRWFGFEHEEIVPDILVIGKAIGGGLPVSVVATSAAVEARCNGTVAHVQSHQNDPFSGRIAATVIDIMREEGLVEAAGRHGEYLMTGLREVQARQPVIAEVRGRGSVVGVELQAAAASLGTQIYRRLLEAGFIVSYQPHNATFRLLPPYVVSEQELDSFIIAFDNILSTAAAPAAS